MRIIAGDHAAAERVEPVLPETGICNRSPRLPRIIAAAGRHYRLLTPVARRMQMPSNKAKRGAGARPEKRFRAKWGPVRVKKTRQIKIQSLRFN